MLKILDARDGNDIIIIIIIIIVVVVVVVVVVLVLVLPMYPSQYFRSNPPKAWQTRKPSKSNSGVRYKPRAVITAGCSVTCWNYLNLFTVAVRPDVTRNHGPFHLLELVLASVSSLLNFGALKMNSDLRYTTPIYRFLLLTSIYFIIYSLLDSLRVYNYQISFHEDIEIKVKQFVYRHGQALRVPGVWDCQISKHSSYGGGIFFSPTRRPPSPPANYF